MKLKSKECQDLLNKYPVKDAMEAMAVKVLTTKDSEVYLIPGLMDLNHDEMDKLTDIIIRIRKDIGLD